MKSQSWNIKALFFLGSLLWFSCDPVPVFEAPPPPTVDFLFQVDRSNPLRVSVAATSSDTDFFYWFFGDNTGRARGQSASYTYPESGTYTIRLQASNKGGTSFVEKEVTVLGPIIPVPNFNIQFNDIEDPLTIELENISDRAVSYLWTFGDGNSSTEANPGSYTYSAPGNYALRLTAESEDGETNLLTRNIRVLDTRNLHGGSQKNWRFPEENPEGFPGAYYIQRGNTVDFISDLKTCELNDRYEFTSDLIYNNQNQGDAVLATNRFNCTSVDEQALSEWSIVRNANNVLSVNLGSSYIGDITTGPNYRLESIQENQLVVSTAISDEERLFMVFVSD